MFLCFTRYIETAFPGKYGVPKPWYFPFTCGYWCGSKRSKKPSNAEKYHDRVKVNVKMEEEPSNMKLGVSIKNLTKVYG